MKLDSVAPFVDALCAGRLLESAQAAELAPLAAAFPEPRALAGELIRRGWLTPYQANQLLQGKGDSLFLGSYVLLERLGEGGMGQVFKAKNWKLGRVVALKLIRKERLASPDAVRRFHREIRAAAQLSHPNIVHAYDADQANGAHFFVMEYVEGIDLARLVKKEGPLPVDRACEYARQAALGLQHASERGLVHRDVKPANMLLTPGGVIKVLDMGLARLSQTDDDGEATSTMTQEGVVMGTPDYMAPEQALDSHTVDVRADLYSLGCTLYLLLTGKPPFPGGSLGEKIAKHQMREPEPVEARRPETPAAVAAVVRKLMAKRPDDRYQTPAEAAAALAEAAGAGATAAGDRTLPMEAAAEASDTPACWSAEPTLPPPPAALARRGRRPTNWRRWVLVGAANAALLAGLAALLAFLLRPTEKGRDDAGPSTKPGEIKTPATPEFEAWRARVAALPAGEQVKAVAAKLKELNPGFDGAVQPTVEDDAVMGLEFATDLVADVSPVRALDKLTRLTCTGDEAKRGKLSDLSPLRGTRLRVLWCPWNQVTDLSPLEGLPLHELGLVGNPVADLGPLKALPLTALNCAKTGVADLSPLKGTGLKSLDCEWSAVSDLSPLRGAPLEYLKCGGCPVSDLAPLRGAPLRTLTCVRTGVRDLAPVRAAPLHIVWCQFSRVTDLTPLEGVPLQELYCDFRPFRDRELLRSFKELATICGRPADEFWKDDDARQAAFDARCAEVAALPPEKQGDAVAVWLKQLNPDFDGKVKAALEVKDVHSTDGDGVREIVLCSDGVTDLTPLRALIKMRFLTCNGSRPGKGSVTDLTPLTGLRLKGLHLRNNALSDLSPLRGMPLAMLYATDIEATDLAPLAGMRLDALHYSHREGRENFDGLRRMVIKDLYIHFRNREDDDLVKSLWCVETFNHVPAEVYWNTRDPDYAALLRWIKATALLPPVEQVNAVEGKLRALNPDFRGEFKPAVEADVVKGLTIPGDQVTNLAPLRAFTALEWLNCNVWPGRGALKDLSPLRGLPLKELKCYNTDVDDLPPLAGMPLTKLEMFGTRVSDLTPLRNMPLWLLNCSRTRVTDLEPLHGLPLAMLYCDDDAVSDLSPLKKLRLRVLWFNGLPARDWSPLRDMPLQEIRCTDPAAHADVLRGIPTLKTINGKPAAAVLTDADKKAP